MPLLTISLRSSSGCSPSRALHKHRVPLQGPSCSVGVVSAATNDRHPLLVKRRRHAGLPTLHRGPTSLCSSAAAMVPFLPLPIL
ncbi:SpoIID/LytB domain-containing protein [Sesbania bispinosa]|nr:SpoIID/LytB domain-containing protein [Sesbania bispinosa]